MTVKEIAEEHGVSRVSIHTYRRRGTFPQPVEGEGTTRLRFRAEEVAAFFEANPKQPGKKRTFQPEQQGEAVTTTPARDRLLETLTSPGLVGLDAEEAAGLVDAHRASVLREAADAVAQLVDDGEHDPDCLVHELRSKAAEAKRP
jgi:DNA-binding transcriptional MerR regulator